MEKRVAVYDNAKFFLILLVVLGHLADKGASHSHLYRSIFIWIYSFHMPLFIFIAGLFYSSSNLKKKVIGYLSMAFIMRIMIFITDYIAYGKTEVNLFSVYGGPWFLFAIACFMLINHLVRDLKPVLVIVLALILALFIGYDSGVSDFLALSRIAVFYPFYYVGSRINRDHLEQLLNNKILKIAGLSVIAAWFAICWFFTKDIYFLRPLFTGRNPYYDVYSNIGFLYRLLCYVIMTLVGLAFLFAIPTGKIKLITYCGQHTIRIYFWHLILIICFIALVGYGPFFQDSIIGKIIWLAACIPVTLICSIKIFDYPAKWLTDPLIKKTDK